MHQLFRATRYCLHDGIHLPKIFWLRRPHTTQERRRWFADLERRRAHPELKLRARRSASNLPDTWDDFPVAALTDRSWKRRHEAQYAPVNR